MKYVINVEYYPTPSGAAEKVFFIAPDVGRLPTMCGGTRSLIRICGGIVLVRQTRA